MSTIAFLGTGTMGLPMARNLVRAGFEVRAWNRNSERAGPLREAGAVICKSPSEATAEAAVMITMLSDAEAVQQVARTALRALPSGSIWIQMSTIGIDGTKCCIRLAEEAHVQFLDAPVLGTREPAEQRRLVVLASGPRPTIDCCERIFGALAGRTIRLGNAGEGTGLKLVVNAWLLGLTGVLAESINLARAMEIDPQLLLEAIADGPVDSAYAHIKGEKMISGDYSGASFLLELALKDAGLVVASAAGHGADAGLLTDVLDRLERASAAGHGDEDMSALAAAYTAHQPLTTKVGMNDADRRREEQRPPEEPDHARTSEQKD